MITGQWQDCMGSLYLKYELQLVTAPPPKSNTVIIETTMLYNSKADDG